MKWQHGVLLLVSLVPLTSAGPGCTRTEATAKSATETVSVVEIEVTPVRRAAIHASVDLVGTLIPLRVTTIAADVDGTIQSLSASDETVQYEEDGHLQPRALVLDIGHAVRKGDVLVQIDPVDFGLALKVAQADWELAKRDLENLLSWKRPEDIECIEAALEEAAAADDRAQADLTRSKEVLAKHVITQGTHDTIVMAARTAAAAMKQAQATLKMARAGPTKEEVAVAQARVDAADAQVRLRQQQLEKTSIRAPYDGVISDRYIDVGDRVTAAPGTRIMQIIDPRFLFAQVAVPEKYQGRTKLRDMATVTAAGVSEELPARVALVNSKVDSDTRTFRVRLMVDNRQGILKAGGFVHVSLPVDSAPDVLVVPFEAVTFTAGRPAVYVYQDGRVKKTSVSLGITDGKAYAIQSGVSEGASIAAGKTSLLADGLPVRVMDSASAPAGSASAEAPP